MQTFSIHFSADFSLIYTIHGRSLPIFTPSILDLLRVLSHPWQTLSTIDFFPYLLILIPSDRESHISLGSAISSRPSRSNSPPYKVSLEMVYRLLTDARRRMMWQC